MFRNIKRSIAKHGFMGSLRKRVFKLTYGLFIRRLKIAEEPEAVRLRLSQHFYEKYDGIVQHGPFKGFQMYNAAWWSHSDWACKLLGFYEKEIQEHIASFIGRKKIFVDIGAADGFFGVASISHGPFEKSYCFEINEMGQKIIGETALRNNVAELISIEAEANAQSLFKIPEAERASSVILIDIEGAEYDLLTDEVLDILKQAHIIIELHDHIDPTGKKKMALRERMSKHFELETIRSGPRDPFAFSELDHLNDNERWLICAEGRGPAMRWLVATPKDALNDELPAT